MSIDITTPWGAVINAVSGILDKVIPDPAQKAAAQLALLQAQNQDDIDKLNAQLSAIVSDSKSTDPWTSRARPSFLYVMYVMILISIPIGVLSIFNAGAALQLATGMKVFLSAIPDTLYELFGVGYLGYTGARSFDKFKSVAK